MQNSLSFLKKHSGTIGTVLCYAIIFSIFGACAYAQLPDNGVFADGAAGANFSNATTSVFRLLKWACGVGGVVAIVMMGFNILNNQPWVKPLIAAFVLFAISGIVHFVFNIAQGRDGGLGF